MCAVFVFLHVAKLTRRLDDNGGESSATASSSLSNDSGTSAVPVGKFVSLCPVSLDKRRLGNQLFNFAAMFYVAQLTGRRIVMPRSYVHGHQSNGSGRINRWFDVPAVQLVDEVVPALCPCRNITESRPLAFEQSLVRATLESSDVKTLLTCGWFQSWRYVTGVDAGRSLRRQLTWKSEVATAVRRFLADHRPRNWTSVCYARVGLHVRAGDLLDQRKLAFGYTIPGRDYFRRAIDFFMRHHGKNATRVQFVVTSDDVNWARAHLGLDQIVAGYGQSADLVFSTSEDAGFDLALLSACDDVIMSTGSYGWWAGWLATGRTVYHRHWPRRGSALHAAFNRPDFFPPRWVAL